MYKLCRFVFKIRDNKISTKNIKNNPKHIKDNITIMCLQKCIMNSTSKHTKADHSMNKLHKVGTVVYFNITFNIWSQNKEHISLICCSLSRLINIKQYTAIIIRLHGQLLTCCFNLFSSIKKTLLL